MKELALKYNLPNIVTVSNWIKCYLTPQEIENKCLTLQPESPKEDQMKESEPTLKDPMIDALEKRIQDLEKLLKHSQLKNRALETMIDIATKEKIEAKAEEIDEQVKKMADMYKMEVEKVKEILGEEGLKNVEADVKCQKTIDMLVAEAKLTAKAKKAAKEEKEEAAEKPAKKPAAKKTAAKKADKE